MDNYLNQNFTSLICGKLLIGGENMQTYDSGKYKGQVYFTEDLDCEDDLDEYVPPNSQREYYDKGGNYEEETIRYDGSIPTSVSHLVGGIQNIVMSGSRNTDRRNFRKERKFEFSEIHHGPIKFFNPRIPPTCDLYEVQATYHHLGSHKGAVGQWNQLVIEGKLPYKYKK